MRSADQAQVDAEFDAVAECVEAAGRVVAVQPEIEGEVVTRTGGDDHHRDVPLGRDARDEGLGPVTACHAEQVGPAVDRLARQRGHVDGPRAFEHGHLGAERGGLVPEPELPDLATA